MTTYSKAMVGYSPEWAIQVHGLYISSIPGDNLTHGNYALARGSISCENLSLNSLQ